MVNQFFDIYDIMRILLVFLFSSLITGEYIGTIAAVKKIKLLHVLFRHGDKVPDTKNQNYPNDPHRDHSYFPVENGGLTNRGKHRTYQFGEILRGRYDEFFGPYYTPQLIYGQSTAVPRTQMSLQLVLAGLFPPIKEQIWSLKGLTWQPVYLVSNPAERDPLLFPHKCPEFKKLEEEFSNQDDVKEVTGKYNDLMTYLTNQTGKSVDKVSTVAHLYNLFKEQVVQNLTLPEWVFDVYPYPMNSTLAWSFHLLSGTTQLRRLNGGKLYVMLL